MILYVIFILFLGFRFFLIEVGFIYVGNGVEVIVLIIYYGDYFYLLIDFEVRGGIGIFYTVKVIVDFIGVLIGRRW